MGSATPKTSTSIWENCLNLPFWGLSWRNMGPMVKSLLTLSLA